MSHDKPQQLPHEHAKPDEWHTHTAAEGAPQHEHGAKANPAILAIVTGGFVITVVLTVLLSALYFFSYMTHQRQIKKETTVLSEEYRAYRAQSEASLSGYGWSDPAAGAVRIPITKAIDQVVQDYAAHRN
ncbi:MAG: hypothetical protein KF902_11500 [Phycisphaeraceae bacterium]|nr:hypothetical protein [Phycisphaeraceae bacterium]MCW5767368.1 hypothetical protein [Phycisphaeraceae bacterium]